MVKVGFSAFIRTGIALLAAAACAPGQVSVVTGQYDQGRTSSNPSEIVLNTSNVNSTQFGLLFSRPVDGFLYAQPLYLPNITINGTTQNVVYVATMNNSVYAFDADNPQVTAPLWHVSLGPTVTPVGTQIQTTLGILSTPVIDPVSGTLYAVALVLANGAWTYELHALDVTTGQEKFGGPVAIQATAPGTAADSVNGQIPFNANIQWQRPALLLNNGTIYIAFGTGIKETETYHGWLLLYNAQTLQQTQVYCTTPNGNGSGIWMSGDGPAADSTGIYYATGNGSFDSNGDWGESVIWLGPTSMDSFTPYDYATLTENDWDLGTTGTLLLPNTNLLVVGGKDGTLYLLNRSNLGGLQAGNTQIVQFFVATAGCGSGPCSEPHHFTVWSRTLSPLLLYSWASNDVLKGFSFSNGTFNTTPFATGSLTLDSPGGVLALSSNGEVAGSGVLWAMISALNAEKSPAPGALYAYDAASLNPLWNSAANPADNLGNLAKFSTPTVANGKIYTPTFSNQLDVYGLHTISTSSLTFGNQAVGTVSAALQVTFTNGTPAAIAAPTITPSGDFAATTTCNASIAPGADCLIGVTFVPTATGTRNGSVMIADSLIGSPQAISLTGTGIAATPPTATLSTPNLVFGGQILGSSSAAQVVTLTNSGTLPLALTIMVSGDFTENDNCGGSLAGGAACNINVAFAPTALGTLPGSITISDNAVNSPQSVGLSGLGLPYPVPQIDEISPLSVSPGSAGFTLTVNGAGFSGRSVVYWNGTALTTTFVSGTQLQGAVGATQIATAATVAVSVMNPSPGGGTSNSMLLPITNATISVWLSGSSVPVGAGAAAVVAGNFNGDGNLDAATANSGANTISILLGNGNGTFQPHVDYAIGQNPQAIAVGDFTANGITDLAVADQTDGTISVLLGNGDGTFQSHLDYAVGQSPAALATGDFNGDGNLDVAVANAGSNTVSVLLGNGNGTFQGQLTYATGNSPASVVTDDFNLDGILDLAVVNTADNTVSILIGNRDGTFQSQLTYATGHSPASVAAGDFNGDGKLDLAVVNTAGNTVSILIGNGDGTFRTHVDYATGHSPASVVAGDFNGDGILDVSVSNMADGTVSILLGNGNGTLQAQVVQPATANAGGLAAADFNNDGRLDLAVTDAGSNVISVLLQSPAVSLSSSSLTFPSEALGTTSTGQTVTLTNTGSASLTISSIAATGNFATTNTCGSSLAPNANCVISVTFTPTSAGTLAGSVFITDSASNSPQTITLTGTGAPIKLTLKLSASVVIGSLSTTGNTIGLNYPAPSGGAVISLSSSNPALASPPSTVTVPAGAVTSAPFTITTASVSSQTPVTLTASYATIESNAKLTIYPAGLYGVYPSPTTEYGGIATTANLVALNGETAAAAQVTLTSSNPAVASVPASVTVPAGSNLSPQFTINTQGVATKTVVAISATYNGVTKSANVNVVPAVPSGVTISAKGVAGGVVVSSNTVSLLGLPPSGGGVIALSTSNPSIAAVPSSVTVAAGSNVSAPFAISTSAVGASSGVAIYATYNGVTKSANLYILPLTVYAMKLSANSITGGTKLTTNRVTLTGAAPAGGLVVSLSSSDPSVAQLPQTVTIPAGADYSPAFSITTKAVTSPTPVTISATYAGTVVSAVLTVAP